MDDQKKLTIKEWNADDRPREKMLAKGISALSDAELLAILISTGTKSQSALDLARAVLASAGNNLRLLGKRTVSDFVKVDGIGKAKAITIMAALELGRRRGEGELDIFKIEKSSDAFEIMRPVVGDLSYEQFWVVFLNRANRMIDKALISSGGVSGTTVDVRVIMKLAIEKLATSLILVHNHPSGNITASSEDKNITSRIAAAAKFFDIRVMDHIIIADNKYFSFADAGMIGGL
ncbi:MAG: DNA repair protein RadC [Salinivirgaceae bacterium]|nr:DNA repair protein RadC [Salinivirgaceae bacterium]